MLSWFDVAGIAAALDKAYPETDRRALTRDALWDLMQTLPGFSSSGFSPKAAPQRQELDAVLWTWMRISAANMNDMDDAGAFGDNADDARAAGDGT